jgi:hypothetical protein
LQAPKKLGEVANECQLDRPGQIWVHVVDDRGIDVDTVCTKADADGQPTNAHGTAVFKEVSAGEHAVALDTALSAKLLERYEALTESTSRTVTVAPGQVAYVPYQLTRKPELSVLVVQKNKPEKRFDDADVQVTGPVNVSDRTKKGTGRIDFGCLPAGPYSITVALASTDAKTFATTLDFATTAEKATLSAPGEKRLVTVEAEPINIVTPHVGIRKTELIIDHGPDDFESETTCVTLSLTQTNDEHRYDKQMTLKCAPESDAEVEVFWDEGCSESEKLPDTVEGIVIPGALQRDLCADKPVKLYVRGKSGPGIGETAGSEINKTGIGGGVVFTMDDITFGLEVCLDHGENRLSTFYSGTNVHPRDPKVQVHLIPSWGMTIGGGAICCPPGEGLVFNVDGQRCESVARVYDGTTWSCDAHPDQTGARWGHCTKLQTYYYCPQCKTFGNVPGNCDFHASATLTGYKKCGSPSYWGCTSGCWGEPARCSHSSSRPLYYCTNCKTFNRETVPCGCGDPRPIMELCGGYYTGAACLLCHQSVVRCNRMFQKLGRVLVPGTAVDVPKSQDDKYFQRWGRVLAYPAQDLAPPDIV